MTEPRDPDSPEERAALEAKELRLWVSVAETGLWCPTCLLPSVIRIAMQRDPSEPTESGMTLTRCLECHPPVEDPA